MASDNSIVKYVTDYARRPGPRYREQGKYSGEDFYDKCLKSWYEEAKASSRNLVVVLDGTDGYLSSFLDESFGRLVYDFGIDEVTRITQVVSAREQGLKDKVISWTFPNWEKRRRDRVAPKNTIENS